MELQYMKWIIFIKMCFILKSSHGSVKDIRLPPSILEPAFPTTNYFDNSFTIECKARGIPAPRYIWLKNDSIIDNKFIDVDVTSGVLNVSSATHREAGVFTCLASNTWGTAVSYKVTFMNIMSFNFENKDIVNTTRNEGQSASLKCRDDSDVPGKKTYDWYKIKVGTTGRDTIEYDNRLGVDNQGTLHFAYVTKGDQLVNKLYVCAITSAQTSTIYIGSRVNLRVNKDTDGVPQSKPRLLYTNGYSQETNDGYKLGFIGEGVELECFVSGNPAPEIEWYHKHSPITSYDDSNRVHLRDYGRRLMISNVTESDEGNYGCIAENRIGKTQSILVFLNVTSKPQWIQAPKSQTLVEGSDANFTCLAKSAHGENAPMDPIWFENGIELLANDSRIFEANKLRFTNISRDNDIMNIQCSIANQYGSIFKDVYLNILSPTVIVSRPDPLIRIYDGDTVSLSITATTDPSQTLSYQWMKGGEEIGLDRAEYSFNRDFSNLTITSRRDGDRVGTVYGKYTCLVYHDQKQMGIRVEIELEMIEPEEPVTKGIIVSTASANYVWIISIVLGMLILVASIFIIMFVLRHRYPKAVYLLEKKELKHKMNPVKDLQNVTFQTM